MPRPNAPWYRKRTNSWYVKIGGRQTPLGVKGRDGRADALVAWHRLMAGTPAETTEPDPKSAPVRAEKRPEAPTVRELADLFLSDAATRLKPNTVRIYTND